ncbi:MAG: hypothetical protein NT088_02760 [Candidatus Omnitrophica bacterium]|nr:hypothetical protein [Candidatus Omnitrophota bacterium]
MSGKRTLLALIIITLFQVSWLYADWWGQASTPVPYGARKTIEEDRLIAGSKQHFTYYVTNESGDAVKNFYRKQLVASNWREINLGKNVPPANAAVIDNMLAFDNGEERIIIVFPPAQYFQDGKTRFTVSRGKIKEEPGAAGETRLLAKPKKDIAPVYPAAVLINLIEGPGGQSVNYYCKDGLAEVVLFYKNNMVLRGWKLESESPLAQVPMAGVKNTRAAVKELVFSNNRNDTCKIGLSQVTFEKELPDLGKSVTNIAVDYEAKH